MKIQKRSCVIKIEVDVEVKDHKTRSKNENPHNWLTAHCVTRNCFIKTPRIYTVIYVETIRFFL
ncbi:uncharacterized protein LOC143069357 isoform X2 [Mytilus galloprovincialis]|uniref:uncharacterized protein LOC143069357 isoform X2 n=1 Tax=Mytilus galloprovincialis TaxID=29158 RepID=UPI003F7BD3CC